MYTKLVTTILLILSLTACSPMGILGGLVSDTPSIEAQVGKTNEKVNGVKADEFTVSKVTDTKTAEHIVEDSKIGTITATGDVTIDESVPVWVWLLLILGWILPSPIEIYRGLGNLFINIKKFIKE